ncbi:MAG: alpha/beta hydrolase [Chloroflexota bacterium]
MTQKNFVFLHGFGVLGGLNNRKAQFFSQKFKQSRLASFHCIDFNPTPKDFEYHTLTGMIDRLRQYILTYSLEPNYLIGISQGANVALNYAHRYGGVKKMLLLAPELFYDSYISEDKLQEWKEMVSAPLFHYGFGTELLLNYGHHQDGLRYVNAPPPPSPMLIIHGVNDKAIPVQRSQDYADSYPNDVELITVHDDHFLRNQTEFIWQQMQSFFHLSNFRNEL